MRFLLILSLTVAASLSIGGSSVRAQTPTITELLEQIQQRLEVLVDQQATVMAPDATAELTHTSTETSTGARSELPFLTITREGAVVFSEIITTEREARTQCEAFAYNTDYMWQEISCTYNGTEIYAGVFIAG